MRLDKRQIRNFDFVLLFLTVALTVYGLIVIYSATHFLDSLEDPFFYVRRQAAWMAMGLAGILFISLINYVNLYYWARYIYLAAALLLILVLLFGRDGGSAPGVDRWLSLGFIDIQPSEYAKPALIIMLAKYLANKQDGLNSLLDLAPALLYTGFFMGLIFLQPDLGTSLVFVAVLLGCIYLAGVKFRHLALIVGGGLTCIPLFWYFLEEYQRLRLLVFIDPDLDPLGAGYQLMQSIIAVGSGGIDGKGIFDGSQVQGLFIPEQHTDFIFSVLAEELGFAGAAVLLVLFFLLIYRILWIGSQSKDKFGAYICCGVATMIIFQVIVNIGMTMGIMPVTGLPLPFMSYGGNALLATFLSIGLVLNVGMRRNRIQFY